MKNIGIAHGIKCAMEVEKTALKTSKVSLLEQQRGEQRQEAIPCHDKLHKTVMGMKSKLMNHKDAASQRSGQEVRKTILLAEGIFL